MLEGRVGSFGGREQILEQSTGRKRKESLRGPGIDELYQQATDARDMVRLVLLSTAVQEAFMYLVNNAERGGEVETLLKRHVAAPPVAPDEVRGEAQLAADARAFYHSLSDSQKRLFRVAFADVHHVGSGMMLGTTREGPFVRLIDTVDRERKSA